MSANIILINFLVKNKIINTNLAKKLSIQKVKGCSSIANELSIPETEILEKIAEQTQINYYPKLLVDEENISNILTKTDVKLCTDELVFPYKISKSEIYVACNNPFQNDIKKSLEFIYNLPISLVLSGENEILSSIKTYFKKQRTEIEAADSDKNIEFITKESELEDINIHDAKTPPIIRLCNTIISDAIDQNASDIHFEPNKDEVSIRFRIDGILTHVFDMPKRLQQHVCTRLKILSNMDISEKRRPQDGRMQLSYNNLLVDLRSSSIPTPYGEKLVMRILNNEENQLKLDEIGLSKNLYEIIKTDLIQSGKLMLVTGPTGSGKTTTLYSALRELRNGKNNIQTVEDPIEYRLKGITQVQVNNSIGVTFASALKSILRQDPDIIMLGEIRDSESAEIAFQAAHTGHQVLSTLHTNDAISTITRLRKLGIDSFIISTCLKGILAQRLVRKTCIHCKTKVKNEEKPELQKIINKYALSINLEEYEKGYGCEACSYSGFKGRIGIYSYLQINNEIEKLIQENAGAEQIIKVAKKFGFQSIEDSAIELIKNNQSCILEIIPHLNHDSPIETTEIEIKENEKINLNNSLNRIVEKKKVLLVEDDENVRAILKMILEKEMYEVREAENGEEALVAMYENTPDLVLCDLMMPIMDGKQFLIKVRSDNQLKHVPIVILTAANTEEKEIELLEMGADDFVGKTSSSEVMLTRVRRQFRA